jgi:predicted dehydrogenase
MHITKIAVIGAGDISRIYLENLTKKFREIEVTGIYCPTRAHAQEKAEKYGIPRVYGSLDELLSDPSTSIVLNLTPPQEHYSLCMACLAAGKHFYTEKALAATLEQGRAMIETAKKKGLSVCGAPDTFMNGGMQTLRLLIDSGAIGKVTGVYATIQNNGHERWHLNPGFFYKQGGGPMMDLGVYSLTALVFLLGSIQTVAGMCNTAFKERVISTEPHFGETIQVETPTQVLGLLHFENGVLGTISASFDAAAQTPPWVEIYGTRGVLRIPAKGGFSLPITLFRPEKGEYCEIPMLFEYSGANQGMGLADQASALLTGRKPRASGELMLHVLEVMTAFEKSSDTGAFVNIESRVERPEPMAHPDLPYILD